MIQRFEDLLYQPPLDRSFFEINKRTLNVTFIQILMRFETAATFLIALLYSYALLLYLCTSAYNSN